MDPGAIAPALLLIAACLSVGHCRSRVNIPVAQDLPCDSPLRLTQPHLFTHCRCIYTELSKWKTSFREVPTFQCSSGYVVIETRSRTVISGKCENETEQRIAECAPEQSLRLAMLLDLGGKGQNTDSFGEREGGSGRFGRTASPPWDDEDLGVQICHNYGRRAVNMKEEMSSMTAEPRLSPQPLEKDPVPFDIHKHGHRYRRTTQCDVQHVLFLLDTSGSIGSRDFRRLTSTLGDLVPLFCKSIEIAAMTFSSTHVLEFCFDHFDNNCPGRRAARRAIKAIPYRGGMTHTAEALQCAFDHILTEECGLEAAAECINVVFFTDGRSNGPGNVCEVVQELKGRRKFESYSIGIGNTNPEELQCIASDVDHDSTNLFQFPSFNNFVHELSIIERVFDNTGYACLNVPSLKEDGPAGFEECSAEAEGWSGYDLSGDDDW